MNSPSSLASVLASMESGYGHNTLAARAQWLNSLALTDEQEKAVKAPLVGHVVVKASAGSGKTKVLTARAAYLLRQGVPAEKILLCTFTRNAGQNMRDRLLDLCGSVLRVPECGTLHSHALKALGGAQGLAALGLQLQADDAKLCDLIDTHRAEISLPPDWATKSPEQILMELSRYSECKSVPEPWALAVADWDALLESKNLVSFSSLLKQRSEKESALKFSYILIDEGQDLTEVQTQWVRRHLAEKGQIFTVGDDCQSIYAFRGTESGLLSKLSKLKGWSLFELTTNFRCAPVIVELANSLMKVMPDGLHMKAGLRIEGAAEIKRFESAQDELDAMTEFFLHYPDAVALTRLKSHALWLESQGIRAKTIHSSKGEEFDQVWISTCEEGNLPLGHGLPTEEERLFYVAVTRAKEHLVVSWSKSRESAKGEIVEKKPSRFLFHLNGLN